jgi:hypothetical protein
MERRVTALALAAMLVLALLGVIVLRFRVC